MDQKITTKTIKGGQDHKGWSWQKQQKYQLWQPQMIKQEAIKSMIGKCLVSMSQKDQTGLQTCNFNTWLIIILRKKSLD